MCDSDEQDNCTQCLEFICKHNPSKRKITPSMNVNDLYHYDRYCLGVIENNSIRILPYIVNKEQATSIVLVLREITKQEVIVLKATGI